MLDSLLKDPECSLQETTPSSGQHCSGKPLRLSRRGSSVLLDWKAAFLWENLVERKIFFTPSADVGG